MPKNTDSSLVKRVIYIFIGSFIHAYGINALLIPHNLLTGGLTGIAMIIEYFLKIPISIMVILLNIPLFIAGYKIISKRFVYLSIVGIVSLSFFVALTKNWTLPIKNPMVAAIYGGLFLGVGSGIIIKNRGSLGGTDIVAVILNKHFSVSIGLVTTLFNFIILAMAICMFDIELAMYTMIAIFVSSKAMDTLQEGFNHKKTVIVISDHSKEIARELMEKVGRGVTFLEGEGAYTNTPKRLIYIVVRIIELSKVKDIIRAIDENAFLTIIDTKEVEGKGFDLGDLY
ncbi:MAG: YitT family protein [Clostridiales bacterium]|nr:YitT family protein [Clostridiales bacterium]